jgi:hypothetical protein
MIWEHLQFPDYDYTHTHTYIHTYFACMLWIYLYAHTYDGCYKMAAETLITDRIHLGMPREDIKSLS